MDDQSLRPVDPATGEPIPPTARPGYYPGYNILSQKNFWDEATRRVVLGRLQKTPEIRFFAAAEAALLQAICDRIMPQYDRVEYHRIPIVPGIDERLYLGKTDGYRYEDMPPDGEAYHLGLQAVDTIAQQMFGDAFITLAPLQQDSVLKTIHDGEPPAAQDIWNKMSVQRFWTMLVGDAIDQYYAHPWSWDEIGFGGPAYPRAYFRLERGEPEPWEVREVRYEWDAPSTSLSGVYEPVGSARDSGSGEGGTH